MRRLCRPRWLRERQHIRQSATTEGEFCIDTSLVTGATIAFRARIEPRSPGELPSAHLAISLAVSPTLFAQLLLVHTSCSEFPTVGSVMVMMVIALVVAIARVYLDASWANLDIL